MIITNSSIHTISWSNGIFRHTRKLKRPKFLPLLLIC